MIDPGRLYLIDSSAWIPALRRSATPTPLQERARAIVGTGAGATTGVVRLELLRGAQGEQQLRELLLMLAGLHQLPTDEGACTEAGRLGQHLRSVGRPVPTTDLLIAAVAIRHDAVLVHRDADYETIASHAPLKTESHL